MPPQHERHLVEVYIHELGKQKMRENARRFRYNQLLSRFNQFREMWGRKMRELRRVRSIFAAARPPSTNRHRRLPRPAQQPRA